MILRSILTDDILSKICVRPPYFALQNLRKTGLHIAADVPVEQPLGFEAGPISGAEAGRHLAILGLCALASDGTQEGRHYYLAHQAHYQRLDARIRQDSHLWAQATGTKREKRSASSFVKLFDQECIIASLNVDYHVLSEKTFDRLYRH